MTTDLRKALEALRELPVHTVGPSNSTWDDVEPIKYVRLHDLNTALDALLAAPAGETSTPPAPLAVDEMAALLEKATKLCEANMPKCMINGQYKWELAGRLPGVLAGLINERVAAQRQPDVGAEPLSAKELQEQLAEWKVRAVVAEGKSPFHQWECGCITRGETISPCSRHRESWAKLLTAAPDVGARARMERARDFARSALYGCMGYLGISELSDKAVKYVAERLVAEWAAAPDAGREGLRRWANTGTNGEMQQHPLGEFVLLADVLAAAPDSGREGLREDERQACWEDFIQVIRNSMKDAPESFELKALHEAIFVMGWDELGTGDGKPIHTRANSAVNEWNKEHGRAALGAEAKGGTNGD